MTMDERSARVLRAVTATVAGDSSHVPDLFTADVVAASPTVMVTSRVELAVELEDHDGEVSEVEVDAGPSVSSGDRVCTEWVASATHSAATDACGEPSGIARRRVTLHGVTVAEFEGDRIRAVRHYWHEADSHRRSSA